MDSRRLSRTELSVKLFLDGEDAITHQDMFGYDVEEQAAVELIDLLLDDMGTPDEIAREGLKQYLSMRIKNQEDAFEPLRMLDLADIGIAFCAGYEHGRGMAKKGG